MKGLLILLVLMATSGARCEIRVGSEALATSAHPDGGSSAVSLPTGASHGKSASSSVGLTAGGAPTSDVGTALLGGRANYANESHGSRYLAMRLDRGTVVRICGAGACWTTKTTDYGPDKDTGDIADIALRQFAKVCGYLRPDADDPLAFARRMGECDVEIEIFGDIKLPETDTLP